MYEKSPEFLGMIKSVSDRMGFTSTLDLGSKLDHKFASFLLKT